MRALTPDGSNVRVTLKARPCGIALFGANTGMQLPPATEDLLNQIFKDILTEIFQTSTILSTDEFVNRYNSL